jgi:hypothetical protein
MLVYRPPLKKAVSQMQHFGQIDPPSLPKSARGFCGFVTSFQSDPPTNFPLPLENKYGTLYIGPVDNRRIDRLGKMTGV